jgi:excisionase family DNA binding protein
MKRFPPSDLVSVPDSPQPNRLFLTADEVGQQLGLKKSRVYELAAGGQLPVVRLGRRILFPRRGIDTLIDEAIERARYRMSLDAADHRSELCAATPIST